MKYVALFDFVQSVGQFLSEAWCMSDSTTTKHGQESTDRQVKLGCIFCLAYLVDTVFHTWKWEVICFGHCIHFWEPIWWAVLGGKEQLRWSLKKRGDCKQQSFVLFSFLSWAPLITSSCYHLDSLSVSHILLSRLNPDWHGIASVMVSRYSIYQAWTLGWTNLIHFALESTG